MDLLLLMLLLVLASCGPAGSGSRQPVPPRSFMQRGVLVVPFQGARDHEVTWLRETVEEHLAVLDLYSVPTHARFALRFYRDLRSVQRAHQLAAGAPAVWQPVSVSTNTAAGWGFFWGKTLHVWAGARLEGPSLAHHFLHVYGPYPGVITHTDPRWARLDFDDWMVSVRIGGRR